MHAKLRPRIARVHNASSPGASQRPDARLSLFVDWGLDYTMGGLSENILYDAALSYQKTAALMAAIKLDLFTRIGAADADPGELAASAGASPRGIRILCDFLVVTGFLTKRGDRYSLVPQSRWFLDRASPRAAGAAIDFLAAPQMLRLLLDDPVAYVRDGGADGLANVSPDNPVWVSFAEAMAPFALVTAKCVADHVASLPQRPEKILDVAAGHGLYGIELARAHAAAAVTAIDWAPVLAVAIGNAEAAGLSDRYRTIPGSAFGVDWGDGYDLVILAHILHHFSEEDCVQLLRKTRAALSQNGSAFIVDFIPDEDRISPPEAAAFSFWMLATTPKGEAYTFDAYSRMGREAGFNRATVRPLPPTPSRLVVLEA